MAFDPQGRFQFNFSVRKHLRRFSVAAEESPSYFRPSPLIRELGDRRWEPASRYLRIPARPAPCPPNLQSRPDWVALQRTKTQTDGQKSHLSSQRVHREVKSSEVERCRKDSRGLGEGRAPRSRRSGQVVRFGRAACFRNRGRGVERGKKSGRERRR